MGSCGSTATVVFDWDTLDGVTVVVLLGVADNFWGDNDVWKGKRFVDLVDLTFSKSLVSTLTDVSAVGRLRESHNMVDFMENSGELIEEILVLGFNVLGVKVNLSDVGSSCGSVSLAWSGPGDRVWVLGESRDHEDEIDLLRSSKLLIDFGLVAGSNAYGSALILTDTESVSHVFGYSRHESVSDEVVGLSIGTSKRCEI